MPASDRVYWAVLAVACAAVLGWSWHTRPVPADALAVVNGVPIDRARVARIDATLGGQSGDKRDALTRAIDEELWLQRAWDLGVARDDDAVRDHLVAAAQQRVLAARPFATPTEAQLRALYARAPERFAVTSGLRVARWAFSPRRDGTRGAWERATAAARLFAAQGQASTPALAAQLQPLVDADPKPLPARVLALRDLRALIGPEPTILVAQLGAGEYSNPVEHDGVIYVYRLIARDAAIVPPFETLGPRIAEEFVFEARERVLTEELRRLRARASIRRFDRDANAR